jgi:hypothetical protein
VRSVVSFAFSSTAVNTSADLVGVGIMVTHNAESALGIAPEPLTDPDVNRLG